MKGRLGFVLNAHVKYSETFLLQEFQLFAAQGYEVVVFEGYNNELSAYPYQRIKALPLKLKSLRGLGYSIRVLFRLFVFGIIPLCNFYSEERRSGTSFIRILKRMWFNAHILPEKVNHLHFCFAEVAVQKELVAKAIGAYMSVSLRGSDILQYPKGKPGCYNRLWKYAHKIHAVSQHVYEEAIKLGLKQDKSFAIIHDAVDVAKIKFNPSDVNDTLRILSIGRLEPVKDHYFALDVIAYLIKNDIDIHYSIIGDGSLRDALLNRIEELRLEKHVQLLGAKDHKALLSQIFNFDLLINTSASEGLGVSLIEAQASGLLTFALDVGSTNESIENKKSGWIINERQPESMAQKIMEVLNFGASVRHEVKAYARKRIEEKFSIEDRRESWAVFFSDNFIGYTYPNTFKPSLIASVA